MKITCVGGGPAGMYCAILAKLRDRRHDVTVVERNRPGATHGWGVSWSDELLDELYAQDPLTGRRLRVASREWNGQRVCIDDRAPVHIGGRYGYAINRAAMQDILTDRARELGVRLRYEEMVDNACELDSDLVVAADGVGSRLRTRHAAAFRPTFTPGRNRYTWLGTTKVVPTFQWHFRSTPAGWVWAWTYPSATNSSTFIVECAPSTWSGLGFDRLGPDAQLRRIERIFAPVLEGHPVLQPPRAAVRQEWVTFREIRCARWYHRNVALVGDAAHTTNFGIGSGTSLGLLDAVALVEHALVPGVDLADGLAAYDRVRRPQVERVQDTAMASMRWFEEADARLNAHAPVNVAYSIFDRRNDQPPWRYQVHLATQIEPLRRVRSGVTLARRAVKGAARDRRHPLVAV